MRSKFDEQLKKLNEEMMHMGSMIEESIQKAIEAFIHQDADSAKAIMEEVLSIPFVVVCLTLAIRN
ncbi:MAG: hypothetical protein ACLR1C_16880, partial [Agathobacter rectalis]